MDYPHWLLHGLLKSICLKHKWGSGGWGACAWWSCSTACDGDHNLIEIRCQDGGHFQLFILKSDDSEAVSLISDRNVRVQDVYTISQLITGCSESRPTSLHLPAFHRMPPTPLPSPSRRRILQLHQGQLKEMIPPHHKIYEGFTPAPPCLKNTPTPTEERLLSLVV